MHLSNMFLLELTVVLFLVVTAQGIGPNPTSSNCQQASLHGGYHGWVPQCQLLWRNQFKPEQCVRSFLSERCWCVNQLTGRSISSAYHARGSGSCGRVNRPGIGQQRCGRNEVLRRCGGCEQTCENMFTLNTTPCPRIACVPTCICRRGFYRHDGRCITLLQCVLGATFPGQDGPYPGEDNSGCPGNQIRVECGSGCPLPTCEILNPPSTVCLSVCRTCVCPTNTVLNGDYCIPYNQCPSTATTQPTPVCPGNQIRVECGSGCPLPTCEIPNPPSTVCPEFCRTCICPTNTVLNGDYCIPYNQCPSTATTPQPTPVCPGNQIRVECGSGCPLPTCEIPNPPSTVCPEFCRTCVCPTNTVLNGDYCIPYNQCPSTATTQPTVCPGNQIRVECGSGCPLPTCEIPNPPTTVCPEFCRTCVCPTNTVLNGDYCIPYNQCPSTATTQPTPVCPGNQIRVECGSGCPLPTCEIPNPPSTVCPLFCRTCVCPTNTVLNGDYCIPYNQCPSTATTQPTPVCPGNQIRVECGSGCPLPTCEIPNPPSTVCPLFCRTCVCPTNTVLNGNYCIPYNQCPSTATTPQPTPVTECPNNLVYSSCAGCDITCASRNILVPCLPVCQQKCTCPPNTYLHGNSCLTSLQCDAALACPGNQIYSMCTAGCDITCQNFNNPPSCLACQARCTCPAGMVLNGINCVLTSSCPTPSPVCPGEQVWNECAGCDVTCAEVQSEEPCIAGCRRACVCPQGKFKHGIQCLTGAQCLQALASPTNP
uniref:SCO-spondin-like isoform X2 n=1 Tax=Ciona intestinalis TaxID=7719 RepID=UPI00089DD396|nr:SCO-spondin-like isoform X2 [Ciona intestinalis]|eukprot:XP_018672022.1 SCO-spondin-like isoform X2 [Ciona intestinalis]